MIRRSVLTIIACSALALAAADVPADTAQARAARYYADGLDAPLTQLRRGAQLLQTCATRWRAACSKEQRALAAKNHTLALLDALTLFPTPPDADAVAGVKRAADLKAQMTMTSDSLLRETNAYDRQVLVRYGAALQACPGDSDLATYSQSLDALTSVELRQFQGVAELEYAAVISAMARAQQQEAERLRALPGNDCAAIVELGQLLMELMTSKLEPWTHEDQRVANPYHRLDFNAPKSAPVEPPPGLAHSVAGNFVAVVATELQLKVFPETAPRIKAIAEAEGFHAD